MSDFDVRREHAMRLLRATGMREFNYLPPVWRLMWRLGLRVPRPHFAGFLPVSLGASAYFAVALALVVQLLFLILGEQSQTPIVSGCAVAGLFFGLGMGLYYAHGRKKHRLPAWRALAGGA